MAYGSTSRASSSRTKKTNTLRLEKPLSSDRKPVKIGDDSTGLLLEDEKVIIEDLEVNRLTVNKGTLTKINGTITLENGERIHNDEDGVLSFQSPIYYFNSASQHITSCQVALIASTGEDCSISFIEAGGVHWNIGLDQDDSDKLKWGNNAVVGTSTQMTLDKSGNLTLVGDLQVNGDDIKCDGAMNLEAEGGAITLDASTGNFLAKKDGTEFSAANSAYAGMILGYTKIANETGATNNEVITIGDSMTVLQTAQGTDVAITFKTPPSENVEIEFNALIAASSMYVQFGISDNATYNSLGNAFEYEGTQFSPIKHDETDAEYCIIKWVLGASELEAVGVSQTLNIAADSSGASSYLYHGLGRIGPNHAPPIMVKAIALPATITTGE